MFTTAHTLVETTVIGKNGVARRRITPVVMPTTYSIEYVSAHTQELETMTIVGFTGETYTAIDAARQCCAGCVAETQTWIDCGQEVVNMEGWILADDDITVGDIVRSQAFITGEHWNREDDDRPDFN